MIALITEIAVITALIFAVQIPLRRSGHQRIRAVSFLLKPLLIVAAALSFVAFDWFASFMYCDILAALYVSLCADTAASFSEYVIRRAVGFIKKREKDPCCMLKADALLTLVFAAGLTVYGCMNGSSVFRTDVGCSADGLTKSHSFAFVSDIHAEDAGAAERLSDICRQINEQHPEFVILGGDITDELTSYDEMQSTYSILSGIEAPVYFIYGNHDRQPGAAFAGGRTYTDDELISAIEAAGIEILQDEYVKIDDDLVLLGREDMSMGEGRKAWSDLVCPYEGALIVADHQPYDEAQLAEEQSALQLSGHTHAGQLFPLQTVYRIMGLPAYGHFTEPGTQLYVTSGGSVWGPPLRTEEHCEWVLVELYPPQ